jgi:group I intron endonuclease
MNNINKDNIYLENKITWYNIDKDGSIKGCLKNKAAVYVFSLNSNETGSYVGSSTKLTQRLNYHKSRINNWNKDYYNNNGLLLFYSSVLKHGWNKFKFGVLEYLDLSINSKQEKKVLLEREQYYLDNINPSLNICKIAGSPLGVKHGRSFSINLSKAKRGKKNSIKLLKTNNKSNIIKPETRLNLSYRSKGVCVKLYDRSNNLVNQFSTMASAAKFIGVSDRTIRRTLETGISYDNYIYKFEVPITHPIVVFNNENNIVKEYYSIREVAKDLTVSRVSISNHIISNKLLKGIYLISRK